MSIPLHNCLAGGIIDLPSNAEEGELPTPFGNEEHAVFHPLRMTAAMPLCRVDHFMKGCAVAAD
jgi:hypothetical protein